MGSGDVAPILKSLISSCIMSSSSWSAASHRATFTSNVSSNCGRLDGGTPEIVEEESLEGALNWKLAGRELEGVIVKEEETLSFLRVSLTMAVVVDCSCDCCFFSWEVLSVLDRPAARSHTLAITFTQLCWREDCVHIKGTVERKLAGLHECEPITLWLCLAQP